MLDNASTSVPGRYQECPCCRSRRPLRNVYECVDGHLFCETCAEGTQKGVLKTLATGCPICRKERVDTVGHIDWDLLGA
jgi:hypothetical protein